jgi:hypothetical protein
MAGPGAPSYRGQPNTDVINPKEAAVGFLRAYGGSSTDQRSGTLELRGPTTRLGYLSARRADGAVELASDAGSVVIAAGAKSLTLDAAGNFVLPLRFAANDAAAAALSPPVPIGGWYWTGSAPAIRAV